MFYFIAFNSMLIKVSSIIATLGEENRSGSSSTCEIHIYTCRQPFVVTKCPANSDRWGI